MKSHTSAAVVLGLAMACGWSLAGAQNLTPRQPPSFLSEEQAFGTANQPSSLDQALSQDQAPSEKLAVPMDPMAVSLLSEPPQPLPATPSIQTDEHGTRYLSGGVTIEEREQMGDVARGFPLRIVSAVPLGNLEPDIRVQISDARGHQTLNLPDAGAVVYVALPPGRYRVNVSSGGQIESRQVVVASGRQQEVAFFWPGRDRPA